MAPENFGIKTAGYRIVGQVVEPQRGG